jgi:hypothetical protein
MASAKMKMKMKRTLRMMKIPPKTITPVAPRSTSLTRAIRREAAAIRSRTPIVAVAMVRGAPQRSTQAPGAGISPAPGAGNGYSSFFSSSATMLSDRGR